MEGYVEPEIIYSQIIPANKKASIFLSEQYTTPQKEEEDFDNESGNEDGYTPMDFNVATDCPTNEEEPSKTAVQAKRNIFQHFSPKTMAKDQPATIMLYIIVAILIAIVIISGLAFAVEISGLRKRVKDLSSSLEAEKQRSSEIAEELGQNVSRLLQDTFGNFTGKTSTDPAPSCSYLLPYSPSGYYWVRASNGSVVRVYCDMTLLCGNITGGWMRVAELDMTDTRQQCPSGLKWRIDGDIRTCIRDLTSAGCSSVHFPYTADVQYEGVCGKVIAYQYGTPNAFNNRSPGINSAYVDGVSLTHGNPRQHIWTFVATLDETAADNFAASIYCPCISSRQDIQEVDLPDFVGNDYFCDTGSRQAIEGQIMFYGADPLWDGYGCELSSTCCRFKNPPWFYKQLSQPTTDDIEMRVCRDEPSSNEDIAVQAVEIYVR